MRCRQRTECRSRTSMMKAPSCTGTLVCLYIAYFTCTFVSSFYIVAFVIIFVQYRCMFKMFTMMANHPGALWRTPLPTRPATPPATLSRSWDPALAATARWSEIFFIVTLGKTSMKKKRFLSGIARMRGGVYPCPNFLALFSTMFSLIF